jgi:hypothetical protein
MVKGREEWADKKTEAIKINTACRRRTESTELNA